MPPMLKLALAACAVLSALPAAAEDYAWLGFAPEKERARLVAQARRFDAAILASSKEAEAAIRRYEDLSASEAFSTAAPEASLEAQLALGQAAKALSLGGAAQKARAAEAEAFRRLLNPYLPGLPPARWETLVGALGARVPPYAMDRYPALIEISAALAKARPDSGARALLLRLYLAADAEALAGLLASPDKEAARVLVLLKLSASAEPLSAEVKAARAWIAAMHIARAPAAAAPADAGALGAAIEALDALEPRRALALAESFPGDAAALLSNLFLALDADGVARLSRALSLGPAQARSLRRIFARPVKRGADATASGELAAPLPAFVPERLEQAGKAISAYRSAEALGADSLPSLRALFSDPLARSLLASAPDLRGLAALSLRRMEALAAARLADPGSGAQAILAQPSGAPDLGLSPVARWTDAPRGLWELELRSESGASPRRLDGPEGRDLRHRLLQGLLDAALSRDEALAALGLYTGRGPEAAWSPAAFAVAGISSMLRTVELETRLGLATVDGMPSWIAACDGLLQRGDGAALEALRSGDAGATWNLDRRLRVARASLACLQALGELE